MLTPVLLLFQVCIHFMSILLECFVITPCQVTKESVLSFSICSIFPDLRLNIFCHLLLAAAAVPLRGGCEEEVCLGWLLWLQAIGTQSALAHHFLSLAKHLGSAENKKD